MVKYGKYNSKITWSHHGKPSIGILLMVLAVLGFLYWEKEGRQQYQEETVLMSARPIMEGQVIHSHDIKAVSLNRSLVIEGALSPHEANSLINKEAIQYIPGNMVLVSPYFTEKRSFLPKGLSLFTIPAHWIYSRSSTLRQKDWVDFYSRNGEIHFGCYQVAFVKTGEEEEVQSVDAAGRPLAIMERNQSTGLIHHIEVLCSIEDYGLLYRHVSEEGGQFLIVQREEE